MGMLLGQNQKLELTTAQRAGKAKRVFFVVRLINIPPSAEGEVPRNNSSGDEGRDRGQADQHED